jgi:uncharacterized protein with HEPN domain
VRDGRERLADVLAAIGRIRRYVQDDRTRFDTGELLQSACFIGWRLSVKRTRRRR